MRSERSALERRERRTLERARLVAIQPSRPGRMTS
jgi:hypothetical protein